MAASERSLRALIFDVDGTLAETEEVHRACFNTVLREAGFSDQWDRDRYRELLAITGGKERLRHHFDQRGQALPADEIAALHLAKNACYRRRMERDPPPLRPGVRALIEGAASAGIALGIATTTSTSNLEALMLGHFGEHWRARFGAVVCGEAVERKKPDPQVYQIALAQLGIAAEHALAIEDSDVGLRAAQAAGIAVVITPSLYFDGRDFSAAEAVIADLAQPIGDGSPPMGIQPLVEWFAGTAPVS